MEHKEVLYKFCRIELEQFAMFEENCRQEMQDVQLQTDARFSFDRENSIFCSRIAVNVSAMNQLLLKAELKSYFNIQPESVEHLRQDGRIVFTPPLLVQFASLCYGTLRGVVFTKTQGTMLCRYVLPPVYFDNIINKGFVVME